MLLVVHLDEIREHGLSLECQEQVDSFPVLQDLYASGDCRFRSPVAVDLRVYPVGGMFEVSGRAAVDLSLPCGRCLQDYELRLDVPVELTLTRHLPAIETDDDEEVELSAEEMGMVLVEGDEYDLHDVIAEHLVIGLPFRPLCNQGCKGLCPVCGIDRNYESCQCTATGGLNKFAALKDFKVQK